jgi:hypothetical protein
MNVSTWDQTLGGYVPLVPEPFWYRGWRTLFRWRPQCVRCNIIFSTRQEWDAHYVLAHLEADEQ